MPGARDSLLLDRPIVGDIGRSYPLRVEWTAILDVDGKRSLSEADASLAIAMLAAHDRTGVLGRRSMPESSLAGKGIRWYVVFYFARANIVSHTLP